MNDYNNQRISSNLFIMDNLGIGFDRVRHSNRPPVPFSLFYELGKDARKSFKKKGKNRKNEKERKRIEKVTPNG